MEGKVALITGSTQGIGLGIARKLASCGCSIILTGLASQEDTDRLIKDFTKKYAGSYHFVQGDLRDHASIADMCGAINDIYPDGIDILINNAGFQHVAPIDEYPTKVWEEMVAVHMTAPFLLVKHFLPLMKRKRWGRIVNTSSQMGMISQVGKTPYSATKAGIIGFTKGVTLESAEYGITSNAICPGFVETDIVKAQVETIAKEEKLSFEDARNMFFEQRHPTKQPVTIDQVASLVWYLCSEEASSITGTTVTIDAGNTAR